MTDTIILELDPSGVVALPKALRERYHLQAGDSLTLLDLGGVFVLSPHRSEIDAIANQMKAEFVKKGETLDSLLNAAREIRDASPG